MQDLQPTIAESSPWLYLGDCWPRRVKLLVFQSKIHPTNLFVCVNHIPIHVCFGCVWLSYYVGLKVGLILYIALRNSNPNTHQFFIVHSSIIIDPCSFFIVHSLLIKDPYSFFIVQSSLINDPCSFFIVHSLLTQILVHSSMIIDPCSFLIVHS